MTEPPARSSSLSASAAVTRVMSQTIRDHVAIEHVAEMDADHGREHVKGDFLSGSGAHARRTGYDLRRCLDENCDIGGLEQRCAGIVGHGDDTRAACPGLFGSGDCIGREAAGGYRNQTVASPYAGAPDIEARKLHIVLVAARKIGKACGPAGDENGDLFPGYAVGARQLERIRHGHQSGASGARIGKPAAGGEAVGGKTGRRRNWLDGPVHGLRRFLLTGCKQSKSDLRAHDVQTLCIVVALFGPCWLHASFSSSGIKAKKIPLV